MAAMALFGSVMRSSLVRNSLAMVRLETVATNSVKPIFVQARNAAQKLEGAGLGHLKKINCRFGCTNADSTICDIIQGVFFNWSALKMTKCQTLRKF